MNRCRRGWTPSRSLDFWPESKLYCSNTTCSDGRMRKQRLCLFRPACPAAIGRWQLRVLVDRVLRKREIFAIYC